MTTPILCDELAAHGTDRLDKKLALLKRLNEKVDTGELAKLVPQRRRQIERLISLKMPAMAGGDERKAGGESGGVLPGR